MRSTITLPAEPTAAHEARAFVHRTLDDWRAPTDVDDAELIVSELVTNAVRYDGPTFTVTVTSNAAGVWIDVADTDTRRAVPRLVAAQHAAETGRSLTVIDSLAEAWGVTPNDGGKHVWVRLHDTELRPEVELAREVLTTCVRRIAAARETGLPNTAEIVETLPGELLRRVTVEITQVAAHLACLCAVYEDSDAEAFWAQQLERLGAADAVARVLPRVPSERGYNGRALRAPHLPHHHQIEGTPAAG